MPDNIEELKKYTTDGAGALTLVKWIQNWHNNNIGDIDKQLPYPVLSVSYPEAGDYAVVTLETDYDPISGGEVVIGYTTDGTTPTEVSNTAEFPMNISRNCTLSVRAFLALSEENIVGSVTNSIAISGLKVQEPVISFQRSTKKVTISSATSGASIRYTLNGDEPTEESTLYSGEITLSDDAVIKAKAFKDGLIDSDTAQLTAILAHVFGWRWDYGLPESANTRLTPETDPYGYVTETVTEEVVVEVPGSATGYNPFEKYEFFQKIKRRNFGDDGTGQFVPAAWDGEAGFSVLKDTMVYIPPFYVNQERDQSKQLRYFYFSTEERSGFELHPGSDQYFAVYPASMENNILYSISGKSPYGISIGTQRTYARDKGYGWQIMDFAEYQALIWLYMLMFTDFNTTTKIGTTMSMPTTNGITDTLTAPIARNADGHFRFLWIESPWISDYFNIDGIKPSSGYIAIILNQS